MILGNVERVAAKSLPVKNIYAEVNGLQKSSERQLPFPQALRAWAASHSLSDAELQKYLDEYDRMWATGSMREPDLIPSNEELPVE